MNLQALTVGAFGIAIFLAVLTEAMIVTRGRRLLQQTGAPRPDNSGCCSRLCLSRRLVKA